jgi:suppressor for copper-sensitivity B
MISILLAMAFAPLSARALESPWQPAEHAQARLLSGADAAGKSSQLDGAIEIKPEEGWHVYWRMGGDGGLPPVFEWKGSANIDNVAIDWPTPKRFETAGLQTFGYDAPFTLPLTIKVKTPGEPVKLAAKADIMVCKDICIPGSVTMDLSIPVQGPASSPDAAIIAKARTLVPVKNDSPALKIESAVVGPDALVVQAYAVHGLDGADLFVEPAQLALYGKPEIAPDKKDPRHATLRIPKNEAIANLAKEAMGKTVVLTLVTKDGAVEKSLPF